MFTQINHQIPPHMVSQIPPFQQPQPSQNSLMYAKQMFAPQAPPHIQIHNQFIEAEQQIQQEIQQLQQLQLQIKLRQQQFISQLNTPSIPMQPYHQGAAINGIIPPYGHQNLNIQNGYNQRKGLPVIENNELSRVPLHLNQDIPTNLKNYNLQQQPLSMYMGDHASQMPLNRKRAYDINYQYSKIEDQSDSPSHENFVHKKLCTEDLKSTTTLLEQSMLHQKLSGYPNMNLMYGQQSFAQKCIPSNISDCSSTQSIRNNQPSINNFGMEQNYSNSVYQQNHMKNNILMVKKEAKNELITIQEDHLQDQNSSDNQNSDKRCKKEIQNDSNYTKNLLKGFRRHMNKKYKDNKDTIEKFQQYFYNNTLSNEFILTLLENSPYQSEFEDFLQTDPQWWIKEAKIKEPTRQLKFFETVKNKNYADIRTKRKGKQTNTVNAPTSSSPSEEQNQQTENIVQNEQQNTNTQTVVAQAEAEAEADNTTTAQ
ncbi:hypothetical protein TTHERM_00471690 (macronuclear) [Tetrahymena thermophila SB210]|uniref:Uncharacterized protein n=1 Tax=Tetrahymena thermophila (strain SB210) TaxID=312017 RepID=I7M031_TETTS|nr:hypothetical protein TTHERM_00471690 [Tetrahymena thermophila SB210]EAR85390.1 hypothetical protein TTHERM_00471690 [Tetrahymena thermophila SB210]|eukprot:XP_001033053.1 hypothetical protein TTHERM_00471690 [Tetrahymena thermophila SB210]